jgi:ribonucleotide reductase alpha subunit
MLSKFGFGTSGYLGDIRGRGSKISVGGKASGILPVLQDFVTMSSKVSQGSQRRGAWAGYIDLDHPDFDEIADYAKEFPDDLNIGWVWKDSDTEKANAGDVETIRRFKKIMKLKMITGKGYFFFVDKVNRANPQMYKDLGLTVKSSNLCCVDGSTHVRIRLDGVEQVLRIDSLHEMCESGAITGRQLEVLTSPDGKTVQYMNVQAVTLTKKVSDLISVKVAGSNVITTPDHKFYTIHRGFVRADELTDEDLLFVDGSGLVAVASTTMIRTEEEVPVYDMTVIGANCFFANGVLVHNCEITLFQDIDHTYSCVLSSMNLSHYNEWKNTDAVYVATVFLDCIAEDFIQKAKHIPAFDKIVRFTEKGRALGLGVCGFHTYLQQNNIPFEGLEAYYLNDEIFKHLHDESLRASQWLAKEFGEPEWCKGYGVRNTHRMAIAPTMSTALLMAGVSQGIEPVMGNVFIQSGAGGEVERINPVFLKIMKARGKYNRKLLKQIADNNGSVQDQDWLTDEEKLVFKTAFETNQSVIIRLAAQRQKYICQAQSINLFFSAEEKEEVIAQVHKEAILNESIKSLYYVRTQSGVQAGNSECVACQ